MPYNPSKAKTNKHQSASITPSPTVETIRQQAQAKGDALVEDTRLAVREVMQETKGRLEAAVIEELESFSSDMGFLADGLFDAFYGGIDRKALESSTIDVIAIQTSQEGT